MPETPAPEAVTAPQEAPATPVKRTRTRKKAAPEVTPEAEGEAEPALDDISPARAKELAAALLLEMPVDSSRSTTSPPARTSSRSGGRGCSSTPSGWPPRSVPRRPR